MNNHDQHIEDYLFDRMDAATKLAFETKMDTDPKFRAQVNEYRMAKEVSADFLELEVRDILDKEEDNQLRPKTNSFLWWIILAVLTVMLLGFLLSNMSSKNAEPPTYASLYAEPTWPIERSSKLGDLKDGISQALNYDFRQGVNTIQNSSTEANLKNYWTAELYAYKQQADSSLYYINKVNSLLSKRDRINYLKILAHYQLSDREQVERLIDALPEDTDVWYMERYAKLID